MEEIIKELNQLSESLYDENQYTWSDQVDEIIEKLRRKSVPAETLVMPKIADIAEKALTQWKLHIEENEQADLEDINHLEALEWKKLNAELQSINSNFTA